MLEKQPHTITGSLAQVRRSPNGPQHEESRTHEDDLRDKAIIGSLTKLAGHYWRPDQNPMLQKHIALDWLNDLSAFTPQAVADACDLWRRRKDAEFFPKPGPFIAVTAECQKEIAERAAHARLIAGPRRPTESRPSMWWMQPRDRWPAHWQETEIPADEIGPYRRWEAARQQRLRESQPPPYVPGAQD